MIAALMILMGCETSCNLVWAPSGTDLTLSTGMMLTEDDEVMVMVEGVDGITTCSYSPEGSTSLCDDGLGFAFIEDGDIQVTLENFISTEIDVTVWLWGSEEAAGTWSTTVEYIEDEPNGEGCGFRQRGASIIDISDAFVVGH